MQYLTKAATLCVVISGVSGSVARAQQAIPQRAEAQLPAPDPVIRGRLQAIMDAKTAQPFLAPMGAALDAKYGRQLTDEAWLTQVLLFMSQIKGEQIWVATFKLIPFSRDYLINDPDSSVRILVPFLDASDERVAKMAGEMISLLVPWVSDRSPDITGAGEFSVFRIHLRDCVPADPSWRFVRIVYGVDADAAMRTAVNFYFQRDARQPLERARKELLILMLSYDVATEEQKPEVSKKVFAKLSEMGNHPHWAVRGYVLAMISRGYGVTSIRSTHWSKETDVPERLSEDKNPFVSGFAKELVQRIRKPPPAAGA